jgi:hypothetical protein
LTVLFFASLSNALLLIALRSPLIHPILARASTFSHYLLRCRGRGSRWRRCWRRRWVGRW